jgi:hypothetical protein
MTIREMHFDFKKKFNKIDSQKNRNLLVPEIDWTLNEAEELFIKTIAIPRVKNVLGFETSQRSIDDIRSIVKTSPFAPISNSLQPIPTDYRYYVRGRAKLKKGTCPMKEATILIQEYGNLFEESPFHKSSFEWGEVNGVFNSNGLQLFTDGTFSIDQVSLTYIRKTNYMHNAQDFGTGSYNHPSGVTLTGSVNCELPDHTHREIVDIAVMLASGEVQASDFQMKLSKLNFNQIV